MYSHYKVNDSEKKRKDKWVPKGENKERIWKAGSVTVLYNGDSQLMGYEGGLEERWGRAVLGRPNQETFTTFNKQGN